jgi:hypothetical protein
LIETDDDANERGRQFKLAGKLGQKNEHAMPARILRPAAIFLSSIFLPDHSKPMTQRQLNRVPASMSPTTVRRRRPLPRNEGDQAAPKNR